MKQIKQLVDVILKRHKKELAVDKGSDKLTGAFTSMRVFERAVENGSDKHDIINSLDNYYSCVIIAFMKLLHLYSHDYYCDDILDFERRLVCLRDELMTKNSRFFELSMRLDPQGVNFKESEGIHHEFYSLLQQVKHRIKQKGVNMGAKDKIVGKLNDVIEDIKNLRDDEKKEAYNGKNSERVYNSVQDLSYGELMNIYNIDYIENLVHKQDEILKSIMYKGSSVVLLSTLHIITAKIQAHLFEGKNSEDYIPLDQINNIIQNELNLKRAWL